ncbi:hypothetical protein AAFN86_08395 [Roseomonas sp. CAU 1739]|uniref:hypothetical protein n=1 Tax=Roseomonas sp. CAU 1739 TaxID=3140364 RepID=UPI00325A7AD9
MRIRGIGGCISVYQDRVVLQRRGLFFTLINLAFHLEREMESEIVLRQLTAVHFVRSLLFVQFLRFSYAGCPNPSGHYLRDAFAENAFMLSFFDNRRLVKVLHCVSEAALRSGARLTTANA